MSIGINNNMLLYLLFVCAVILFVIMTYIKVKYGFWVMQPVFHVYDIFYMIRPPGIINHHLPDKNKYTNFKNIETIVFNELSALQMTKFMNFIRINYLQNKDNVFAPLLENVAPYFTGLSDKAFVSFYTENTLLMDSKKGTTIDESAILGTMTSRPVNVRINNGGSDAAFDAYYVDYLCVDKSQRKKGLAPQIIQTHHYNQSHVNKKIVISLFKREDELTGIVPLCIYSTYGFSVTNWRKPDDLPAMYSNIEINPQNSHVLFDFMKQCHSKFDIVINSEISNIVELIKTNNIYVTVIMKDDAVQCAYFFRKTCVFIEKDMEALSCFASLNACKEADVFVHGFKVSFWKIADKNKFGFSVIERISHNGAIVDNLIKKTAPLVVSPTAYFFYNFAYHTFKPDKVFILN